MLGEMNVELYTQNLLTSNYICSFYLQDKDRIEVQGRAQNLSTWKYKAICYIFHLILAWSFICQNVSSLLLLLISFTNRTDSQSVTAAIGFKSTGKSTYSAVEGKHSIILHIQP